MIPFVIAPLGHVLASAAVSAGLVKAMDDGRGPAALRRVAVSATKAGIRAARAAESGVERTRLVAGDVVAQAYGEMGEQVPVRDTDGDAADQQR
ncbi:uncharacterized protein DUF1490 [Kineococcus xinjiangensis]|uniref:Uncharacterized protein DUF1490 n=1 Tax=Kineococcus xinjiangensis TaxID=512762 RepID=A0A2S6IG63_9ACTN|nr:DUF1490 family protein [Kineococcus xinjiangensis]PPK93193.1 uncharacterized protein DUF1490 [Kineococcus xinjiangensis]